MQPTSPTPSSATASVRANAPQANPSKTNTLLQNLHDRLANAYLGFDQFATKLTSKEFKKMRFDVEAKIAKQKEFPADRRQWTPTQRVEVAAARNEVMAQHRATNERTRKVVGAILKIVGVVNAVGGGVFLGHQGLVRDRRVTPAVTPQNVVTELTELQKSPASYLQMNYKSNAGPIETGVTGHLHEHHKKDGAVLHYRRVPEDMFDALQQRQKTKGVSGDQVFVTEMIQDANGKAEAVWVQIRPPSWEEGLNMVSVEGHHVSGERFATFDSNLLVRVGPEEGQQIVLDLDAHLGAQTDGESKRVRIGFASLSAENSGVGARKQQSWTYQKNGVELGTLNFNHSKTLNLTEPHNYMSGRSTEFMVPSVYQLLGLRARDRIDLSVSPSNTDPYGRMRFNSFFEFGLGLNLARTDRTTPDGNKFMSLDAYYELQHYSSELRIHTKANTWFQDPSPQNVDGWFKDHFKKGTPNGLNFDPKGIFEIDPAFQFKTNEDSFPPIDFLPLPKLISYTDKFPSTKTFSSQRDSVGAMRFDALSGITRRDRALAFNKVPTEERVTFDLKTSAGDTTKAVFAVTKDGDQVLYLPEQKQLFDVEANTAVSVSKFTFHDASDGAGDPSLRLNRVLDLQQAELVNTDGSEPTRALPPGKSESREDLINMGTRTGSATLADGQQVDTYTFRDKRGEAVQTVVKVGSNENEQTFIVGPGFELGRSVILPSSDQGSAMLHDLSDLQHKGGEDVLDKFTGSAGISRIVTPDGDVALVKKTGAGPSQALVFAADGSARLLTSQSYGTQHLISILTRTELSQ